MFCKNIFTTFFTFNSVTTVIDKRYVKSFLLLIFIFFVHNTHAFSQVAVLSDKNQSIIFSTVMEEWVDSVGVSLPAQVIKNNKFVKTNGAIPIYPNHIKSTWYKFTVNNTTSSSPLFLDIAYTNLSRVSLYKVTDQQISLIGEDGNERITVPMIAGSPNIIFGLQLPVGSTQQYLLHVFSEHPILLPATIHTYDSMNESINLQTIIMGLYLGVLIVMFLYNLFLFFATKDNSYLFYIIYIFFLALAQTTFVGYEYRFIWPHFPALNKYAVVFTSSLSAIAGLVFSMIFLRTAVYAKKIHKWLQAVVGVYVIGLVFNLFSNLDVSYYILNYNGILGVILVLVTSLYIARRNFRPAYFYLTAWLFFLMTFIILILRNLAVLPYNNFTTYIIYAGSSLEIALLSIALADKINVLRKEKEDSQAESLEQLQINEKLVRDQNVMLEKKVTERTEELQSSNHSLGAALQDLKDTQIQLVEAEKMASLGQLTAGIAHEINNPINFVKSNIKPLQLDINDLLEVIDEYDKLHSIDAAEISEKLSSIEKFKKQIDIDYVKNEIENLVKGIQDGAERTAEIVLGLRNFSRLDESDIKTVNIHEGFDSTLILLKNQMPDNIQIIKNFNANGMIECLPGKLNQVFMNILSNGIHAIKAKEIQADEESITISTEDVGDSIIIKIKDTGIGMSDEVKQKIFDPFFTTKDVGEGTGLGLSIVFKIIQRHEGKIEVISSKGNGAEFIITLFHTLPETAIS